LCGEDPSGTHSDDNRWRFEALKGGNKSLCDGSTNSLVWSRGGCGYHSVGSEIRGIKNLLYTIDPPEIRLYFRGRGITDGDNNEIHVSLHRLVDDIVDRFQIRRVSPNKSDVLLPLKRFNCLRRRSRKYEKGVLFRLRS